MNFFDDWLFFCIRCRSTWPGIVDLFGNLPILTPEDMKVLTPE